MRPLLAYATTDQTGLRRTYAQKAGALTDSAQAPDAALTLLVADWRRTLIVRDGFHGPRNRGAAAHVLGHYPTKESRHAGIITHLRLPPGQPP